MRPYAILVAAVPLVLSAPAPIPQPGLLTGLTTSVTTAVANLGTVLDAIPAVLADLVSVTSAVNEVTQAIANGTLQGTDVPAAVNSLFRAVKPTGTITSIPQATSIAAAQFGLQNGAPTSQTYQSFLTNVLGLVLNGFTSSDLTAVLAGASTTTNSVNNNNTSLFTSQQLPLAGDPSYLTPEATLRAAMYIPVALDPLGGPVVIFCPGTGGTGGVTFESNIGKLLAADSAGYQLVYLNIPGNLLNDAQINAEFVAYAVSYTYKAVNPNLSLAPSEFVTPNAKQVAIITWSQGSLDAQWAFKYWPSTRSKVMDHIAISPDYHGTILSYLVCPGFAAGNAIACDPAVIQQSYNSSFINKLRSNGGATAYTNVTTIYSGLDEIVQPQQGTAASGFLAANTTRYAQTSNTYVQGSCAGQVAGSLYTHEGMLYNPVTYALIKDALTNAGPGSFSRVSSSCADVVAPGLSLDDIIETEALIPLFVYNNLSYLPRALTEPEIKSYATY